MISLTDLANAAGSDKGSLHREAHRYTYLYDLIFHDLADADIHFLEMGLAIGADDERVLLERRVDSPSVQMWLKYFTRAHIYGFDISDFSHIQHPRFNFLRGDSGELNDLQRLATAAPHFDIIIDDASHASFHQQLSFKVLYPRLAPGGLYIIEDLHWQPAHIEAALPPVPKTAEFFKQFFEQGDYLENSVLSHEEMADVRQTMASCSFFPSFHLPDESVSKLIVLRKAK
jgi:hypothetical protein